MKPKFESSVAELSGVGPSLQVMLAKLGILTTGDLINHFPARYVDYSEVQKISKIMPGKVTIKATIKQVRGRYSRRGLHITEAVASDETDSVRLIWFNQPYRSESIKANEQYYVSGNFELKSQRLSIINPSMELVSEFPLNTARIVPVYRLTAGLKTTQLRRIVKQALSSVGAFSETLPTWLIERAGLISREQAYWQIHFPGDLVELEKAKYRLGFEEVFCLVLASQINKVQLGAESTPLIKFDKSLAQKFVNALPFNLTDDQRRAIWRVYQNMSSPHPMNRLIEGDVGSGKTVVAAMAALMVINNGFQAALMAPTELLARQHAETIYDLFKAVKKEDKLILLLGGLKSAGRAKALEAIKSEEGCLVVGTHALIQSKVKFKRLGLIIIDEQHRFGVEQRNALKSKAKHLPHILSTTATPIPRSLALTLYGDLDISVIAEKPAGRKPPKTTLHSFNFRQSVYEKVRMELDKGRQAFVICPLIDASGSLDVLSAETVYSEITKGTFINYKVGLLHGRLKAEQKESVMAAFAAGKIDVLVATTMVEVGVDIPNASAMVIENADRFGLAQIHQLRGRIGRGGGYGHCFLITDNPRSPSQRLKALETSSNGFELAELDLQLRGPGAIYGTAQHGQLDLRIASLSDTKLISQARDLAAEFINKNESLITYNELNQRVQKLRAVTRLD